MKRTGWQDVQDQKTADEFLSRPVCRGCKSPTEPKVLSELGAYCDACFTWYVRDGQHPAPLPMAARAEMLQRLRAAFTPTNPRAWIDVLRDRQAKGERLSPAQTAALRAVDRFQANPEGL
jgi:hypothetical protein